MRTSLRAWFVSALLVAPLLSCGADHVLAPAHPQLSLSGPDSLKVGDTATMQLTAFDALGNVIPPPPVTWSSTAPGIATVSAAGTVTGIRPGATLIRAQSSSYTAYSQVIVFGRALELLPLPEFGDTIQLAPGQTIKLFSYEHEMGSDSIVPTGPVTWTSSRSDLATVSDSGLVHAIAEGVAEIRATADGPSATRPVRIAATTGTAAVRFVNANDQLGSIALRPNGGTPVDVAYLEVHEQTVPAGTFQVYAPSYPPTGVDFYSDWLDAQQYTGFLPAQSGATFVVTGNPYYPGFGGTIMMAPLWDWSTPVSPDSVMVRVVLATTGGYNVYYTAPGAPMSTIALQGCYLDWPYGVNSYSARAAGAFDIVLQAGKDINGPETARFSVTPVPGRATTYILAGGTATALKVLPLVDP